MIKKSVFINIFFDHYECDCSSEGYQQLKNKILQIANANNYEVWHEKILKKFYLEDEPDENNTKLDFLEFSYDDYNNITKDLKTENINDWEIGYFTNIYLNLIDAEDSLLALIPYIKPYEIPAYFQFGGGNRNPLPEYKVAFAKHLYEKYNATITTLYYDILEFYMPNPLIKEEDVVYLAKELIAIDWDVYEDMEVAVNIIYGKHKIPLWWD